MNAKMRQHQIENELLLFDAERAKYNERPFSDCVLHWREFDIEPLLNIQLKIV